MQPGSFEVDFVKASQPVFAVALGADLNSLEKISVTLNYFMLIC